MTTIQANVLDLPIRRASYRTEIWHGQATTRAALTIRKGAAWYLVLEGDDVEVTHYPSFREVLAAYKVLVRECEQYYLDTDGIHAWTATDVPGVPVDPPR